jgi:signal transduction histidine kinase
MSERARERLGAATNVLDGMPEQSLAGARRVLAGESEKAEIATDAFRRPGAGRPVQVSFSRVLAYDDRVWLSAHVRERASDFAAPAAELNAVQESVLSHYFRLQRIEEKLKGAHRGQSRSGRTVLRLIEQERTRVGRELHAGVGQALAGIRVHLEIVHAHLPTPPEPVRSSLERIGTLAADALQQTRSVAHRLHPPDWEFLPLGEALRRLWDLSGIPAKYEAVLDLPSLAAEPPYEVKVLVYRTAQEAISNLIRHAAATRVRLSLSLSGRRFVCSIEDNGKGFDVEGRIHAPAAAGQGIGLRSIREQAAALGGWFTARSGPQGTTLVLSLPADGERRD